MTEKLFRSESYTLGDVPIPLEACLDTPNYCLEAWGLMLTETTEYTYSTGEVLKKGILEDTMLTPCPGTQTMA